jgi:hypothetical protein
MTQDEIIALAREAGFVEYELDDGTTTAFDKRYEAFAKLVAAKAFQNGYEKGVAAFTEAVNLEREACAKTALETSPPQRPRVVFPTMLRKMWSGGEVQAWLDENVDRENT